jgi:hypothetical protein
MLRRLLLGIALTMPLATAALAQIQYGPAEERACRHDAVHFCKGMTDQYQVRDCLVAQKARISRHCRTILETHGF